MKLFPLYPLSHYSNFIPNLCPQFKFQLQSHSFSVKKKPTKKNKNKIQTRKTLPYSFPLLLPTHSRHPPQLLSPGLQPQGKEPWQSTQQRLTLFTSFSLASLVATPTSSTSVPVPTSVRAPPINNSYPSALRPYL